MVEWTHFTSREVEYGTLNIAVDNIIKALCKELPELDNEDKSLARLAADYICTYETLKQWGKDD